MKNTTETCRHSGCERLARLRGLCVRHYNRLRLDIAAGKVESWEEAEAQGICLAARPHDWRVALKAGR